MDQPDQSLDAPSLLQSVARVLDEGGVAVLATLIEGPRAVGVKLLFGRSAELLAGVSVDVQLAAQVSAQALRFLSTRTEASTFKVEEFAPELVEWRGTRVLLERIEPEPHIVVCGAGHVGAALARLARVAGYRVTLIDDRPDFVRRESFPDPEITLVSAAITGWGQAVQASVGLGRGVAVAVVTRGHHQDEMCLRAVIEAQPDYVGMIGSRRRTNIVLGRLREAGVADELLRQVRAPVGLDIGAVTPEEVALSILAEMITARRGGTGQSLSAWRRTADHKT